MPDLPLPSPLLGRGGAVGAGEAETLVGAGFGEAPNDNGSLSKAVVSEASSEVDTTVGAVADAMDDTSKSTEGDEGEAVEDLDVVVLKGAGGGTSIAVEGTAEVLGAGSFFFLSSPFPQLAAFSPIAAHIPRLLGGTGGGGPTSMVGGVGTAVEVLDRREEVDTTELSVRESEETGPWPLMPLLLALGIGEGITVGISSSQTLSMIPVRTNAHIVQAIRSRVRHQPLVHRGYDVNDADEECWCVGADDVEKVVLEKPGDEVGENVDPLLVVPLSSNVVDDDDDEA